MNRNNDSEPNNEKKTVPLRDPKDNFETMIEFYLASNPVLRKDGKVSELEVRFGTNPRLSRPISKIDYDNVVKQLKSAGFSTSDPDGLSILRIYNEFTDKTTGEVKMSRTRAEIPGVDLIQEYCRSNSIQKILNMPATVSAISNKIKFTNKSFPKVRDTDVKPVEFPDFNFRVAYQMEQDFTVNEPVGKAIISKWNDSRKSFRYINRVRFTHPDFPVSADISIVKSTKKIGFTVQDVKLFDAQETYEVELELNNSEVGTGTAFDKPKLVLDALRKCIRTVLSGLQGTNYPISYSERDKVIQSYMRVINDENYQPRRILPRDFVGPASYTLQLENIQPEVEGSSVPNIRKNYTVTDKADGERKLLYVANNGRIYMIDTNMSVIFTGTVTRDLTLQDSILDGEHIKYDKRGKYINLFAAFDIYYKNKQNVRAFGFVPSLPEEFEKMNEYRLPILQKYITDLKPVSILDQEQNPKDNRNEKAKEKEKGADNDKKHACGFTIKCKDFYMDSDISIFHGCSTILEKVRDGTYEYNTDGLIFTPTNTGVGSDRIGIAGPITKSTWAQSFKWKPPKFNTIDFLVSVKKDKTGKDEVHNIFQEGKNLAGVQNIVQYKTIILRCGFDPRKHGYLNPMLDMINDNLPSPSNLDNEDSYKPVAFQPTNPYDPTASICNVMLRENGKNSLVMLTEEQEYFEEDTIVEFSYDPTKEAGWKWTPLRVRYDKTNELRSGLKNYGNAYHVANGNWHSIHNPVTEEMISTGNNIPETSANEDVYYNRSGEESSTKPLRDFHNLYVKKSLINGVAQRGQTLIDYAVGKAGDLPKWVGSNLSFVFGVDVSKDNIENHLDGACARYLNFRKKYRNMPAALFVNGNSGANIRSGKAMFSEKDREITKAVFGTGPKDQGLLGKGVYNQYGKGAEGFNVSSCQFALHYFFENPRVFHQFLRNIAECTKIKGYFIGTCYDGSTVFNLLRNKQKNEGMTIMRNEKKIYEIIKQYDQTGFPDDELSLGYAIDVYQETINKVFREYLVNFKYLTRVMENYGFALVSKEESRTMGLPSGSGLFNELYNSMMADIERDPRRAADYGRAAEITPDERRISFMNRYFVFVKVRNVNSEKVAKMISQNEEEEEEEKDKEKKKKEEEKGEKDKEKEKSATTASVSTEKKPIGRKIKGSKVILNAFSPVLEKDDVGATTTNTTEPAKPKIVIGEAVSFKIKKPVAK